MFPLQVVILLSAPERDFTGGEFMLVEQRPRTQSRGEVVPLIDLRVRFGLPAEGAGRSTKWILLNAGGERSVGIIVDAVTEVFGTGEGIRPTPEVGGNRDLRGIAGVVNHGGQLTFVLDTARFIELADALSASGAL